MRQQLSDGINVTGVIDRVDRDSQGYLTILDYKTGKPPNLKYSDETNDRILHEHFFQLKIYALLIRAQMKELPRVLRLLFLGGQAQGISMELNESDLEKVEQELRQIWQAIQTSAEEDDFPTKTGKLCDWCSFKSICPAWQGWFEAASKAQEAVLKLEDTSPALPTGAGETIMENNNNGGKGQ